MVSVSGSGRKYDFRLALSPYLSEPPDGDHYEETNSLGPETVPLLMDAYRKLPSWEP